MRTFKNYTEYIGKKYHRLTITDYKRKNKNVYFICKCDCGNVIETIGNNVITGKSQSCGCLRNERITKSNSKKNKYDLSGNYGIGWTFKNEEFYFDLEDYDKIKNYCWSTRHGYLRARNPKTNKDIIMHRLIMNITDPKLMVDHIKHNKLDNRKQFLRVCTNKENSRNKELVKWNTSGIIGVSYNEKTKLWRSHIMVDRKTINLGTFDNIDDAIDARQKAEDLYFGEYSYRASMNHI